MAQDSGLSIVNPPWPATFKYRLGARRSLLAHKDVDKVVTDQYALDYPVN